MNLLTKPNRYLANLLRNKAYTQNISCIRDQQGTLNFNNKEINNIFKTFYKQLYSSQFNLHSKQEINNFFTKVHLPQITSQQREDRCRPLTQSEIKNCIQILPNNKAPGPDGFNAEFYKKFNTILVNPLFEMLQASFGAGALPLSLMEANISLVLKKGKPPEECSSYRPISVLNLDMKLLARVLASRLENVLPAIIINDQTGFI